MKRLTPQRPGIVAAVVTLSFSQILLQLIGANVAEFPEQASFHLGILFWAWLLPCLAALGADLALVRDDAA